MKNPDQDMIDMIAKTAPDTPVNEDHRVALRRKVLQAYDQRTDKAQADKPRNPLFTFTGATVMKFAASLALLTAIGVFAITTMAPSKAIAFEDVAREIMKIETASYELTQNITYPDGRTMQVMNTKVTMKLPDVTRIEGPGGVVMIIDVDQDKMLMLMQANKMATLVDGISSEFGTRQDDSRFFGEIQDHLRRAEQGKRLDDIQYEKLEETEIDGRTAIGFRVLSMSPQPEEENVAEAAEASANAFDVWADAENGMILRLAYKTPTADQGTLITSYENFVYNQKLDPKLFSLRAPEGYQLVDPRQGALIGVTEPQENEGTLSQTIDVIGNFTVENDGFFPPTLSAQFLKDHLTEQWKLKNPDKPLYKDEEKSEFTEPIIGRIHGMIDDAFGFIRQLDADGVSYTYAGEGVKLGDAETPILWFKAEDADEYTVVYGDKQIKYERQTPAKP